MLMCGTGVFIRHLVCDNRQFIPHILQILQLNRQFNIDIRLLAPYIRHLHFYSPLQLTYSSVHPRYLPPKTTLSPTQLEHRSTNAIKSYPPLHMLGMNMTFQFN